MPELSCIKQIKIFYKLQTTLQHFKHSELSVVRQHEEFVWLHDRFVENEEYAGIIVSILLYFRTVNRNEGKVHNKMCNLVLKTFQLAVFLFG